MGAMVGVGKELSKDASGEGAFTYRLYGSGECPTLKRGSRNLLIAGGSVH